MQSLKNSNGSTTFLPPYFFYFLLGPAWIYFHLSFCVFQGVFFSEVTLGEEKSPSQASQEFGGKTKFFLSPTKTLKEWTFLTFLNGHNDLDYFGKVNLGQMEQSGSSDQVNIIVQWASLKNKNTQRVYVRKGKVDLIETLSPVDMGDYQELIKFIQWGVKKYPAKKYFINIWNHGGGWRSEPKDLKPKNISWDDRTGHSISTEQLKLVMDAAANAMGHPVDIYGSDACLMSMAEVAYQMRNSVHFSVGSEEVEPGEGWPYAEILNRWLQKPQMDGGELAQVLTEEYHRAYTGGVYGRQEVTFSALDLSHIDKVAFQLKILVSLLNGLPNPKLQLVRMALGKSQKFTYKDYRDLVHFLLYLKELNSALSIPEPLLDGLLESIKELVIINKPTGQYANSYGISIWMPDDLLTFEALSQRYQNLDFNSDSKWGDFLRLILNTTDPSLPPGPSPTPTPLPSPSLPTGVGWGDKGLEAKN